MSSEIVSRILYEQLLHTRARRAEPDGADWDKKRRELEAREELLLSKLNECRAQAGPAATEEGLVPPNCTFRSTSHGTDGTIERPLWHVREPDTGAITKVEPSLSTQKDTEQAYTRDTDTEELFSLSPSSR